MPLKLVPPNPTRRQPHYRVRGTYLGIYVDRTTETADRRTAAKILAGWKLQIERGEIAGKGELTFDAAVVSYIQAGGDSRFLQPIIKAVGIRQTNGTPETQAANCAPPSAPP